MSYAGQLLTSSRRSRPAHPEVLVEAIEALSDCVQACAADVDADLAERNLMDLVQCIRLCLDCGDICAAAVTVLSRGLDRDINVTGPLLESCSAACAVCGDECERHARMHEHCRVCAEACRRCERVCTDLLQTLT
jgi:hypothetical protein